MNTIRERRNHIHLSRHSLRKFLMEKSMVFSSEGFVFVSFASIGVVFHQLVRSALATLAERGESGRRRLIDAGRRYAGVWVIVS